MPPMEALATAAAAAATAGAPSDSAAGDGGPPGPWSFPAFVGCRRPLPPDDELFEAGNLEREALARQVGAAASWVGAAASWVLLLCGCCYQVPPGGCCWPDAAAWRSSSLCLIAPSPAGRSGSGTARAPAAGNPAGTSYNSTPVCLPALFPVRLRWQRHEMNACSSAKRRGWRRPLSWRTSALNARRWAGACCGEGLRWGSAAGLCPDKCGCW